MRIGYFGGSFDPPHRGHLAVARAARDRFALDRVLLAPTGRQPLKPHGPEATFADRLRMVELLCAGEPRLEASAIDAPLPGDAPNYTVDTLRRLHASLPSQPSHPAELFAILGADAFRSLRQWREPDELLRLAQWIVVSRPTLEPAPFDPAAVASPSPGSPASFRIHQLDGISDPTTATALRSRLQSGQDCRASIPPLVLAYILARGLYRPDAS